MTPLLFVSLVLLTIAVATLVVAIVTGIAAARRFVRERRAGLR